MILAIQETEAKGSLELRCLNLDNLAKPHLKQQQPKKKFIRRMSNIPLGRMTIILLDLSYLLPRPEIFPFKKALENRTYIMRLCKFNYEHITIMTAFRNITYEK